MRRRGVLHRIGVVGDVTPLALTTAVSELVPSAGPAALSMAVALAGARAHERRRRRQLNGSLHELRRPLQALLLGGSPVHLEQAIDALGELDRRLNGSGVAPLEPRLLAARELVQGAVDRWREPARGHGADLRLDWAAGDAWIEADPTRIAGVLDNLIANAIEHGHGVVELRSAVCPLGLRIVISNHVMPVVGARRADPRRGHGLRLARATVRRHRGELRCEIPGGARHRAIVELPVAPAPVAPAPVAPAPLPATS